MDSKFPTGGHGMVFPPPFHSIPPPYHAIKPNPIPSDQMKYNPRGLRIGNNSSRGFTNPFIRKAALTYTPSAAAATVTATGGSAAIKRLLRKVYDLLRHPAYFIPLLVFIPLPLHHHRENTNIGQDKSNGVRVVLSVDRAGRAESHRARRQFPRLPLHCSWRLVC